jgi:hypothetical protein
MSRKAAEDWKNYAGSLNAFEITSSDAVAE